MSVERSEANREAGVSPASEPARSAPIDMARIKRVLIIKMSAMGDIIHALPVSAALKETYPHLELCWAVENAFAPLVQGNPCLTKVFQLPKMSGRQLHSLPAWNDCVRRLGVIRRERFDMTLDLQGLTKSAVVAAWSGAPIRLGYHWLRELAPLMEKPVPQQSDSLHIVDQYLDVARYLGSRVDSPHFPIHVGEEDAAYVAQILGEAGIRENTPFVAINPASAQRLKEWGAARYGALIDAIADELGMLTVLVTADAETAAQVQSSAQRACVNLAKRTNLKQLAGVLERCAAHVCGDTGSGHIAAAFGRPVISIVGPTDPDRSCPYGQRELALSRRDLCGADCDGRRCQFGTPRCLEAVQTDDVIRLLRLSLCKPVAVPV